MGWKLYKLDSNFGDFANAWDKLNKKLYGNHPLFDSRFVSLLLLYFGSDKEFLCVHTSAGGTIDGMILLRERKFGVWALFAPSQAQVIPVLVYDPVILNSELFKILPGFAVSLELVNQDPSYTVSVQSKISPLFIQKHDLTINVSIDGEFEDYWKSRSKNLQKNVKRYLNRISKENKNLRIEAHVTNPALQSAVLRYGKLESKGWKAAEGTAIHPNNKQGKFYLQMLSSFLEKGQAVVYELYLDNELIGSRLCISNDSILIILKTAYDEECSQYAPGRLLLYFLLKREFSEDRVKSIEFYTNATKEQISWSTGQRRVEHLTLYRSPIVLSVFRSLQAIKHKIKRYSEQQKEIRLVVEKSDNTDITNKGLKKIFELGELENFNLSKSWFDHLAKTGLKENKKPVFYYLKGKSETQVQALLPMVVDYKQRELQSLTTFYSSHYKPLLQNGQVANDLNLIFESIKADEHNWVSINLQLLPKNESVYESLYIALRKAGWVPFRYFFSGNWYLKVNGRSYAEYFESLPSKLRHTIIRKKKKFLEKEGGELRLIEDANELESAIIAYEEIYNSSWKKEEPYPEFIPGLMRILFRENQLRLGIANVGGQPVAAQIWIITGKTASIYKLAYDENFASLSAGTLLTDFLMKQVIDIDKVDVVDFLVGDEPYRENWMSHRRERWGIIAYNPRNMAGKARILVEYGKQIMKGIAPKLVKKYSGNKI